MIIFRIRYWKVLRFKKCIIATDIGSLRETVIDNETGILFKIKDCKDLKNKVEYLFNDLDKRL